MGLLANVPTLSYVQWKNLLITYKDVTYQIENSHTNKPFIYWDVNNPYVLTTSNIKLEDRTGLFYVLFNDSGSYLVIPNNEVDIEFSENPSRDAITERIVGLSNNTKDQFASVQVDVDGIKTTIAKCQEDINGHTQTISTIEQKTDEINLEIENIERQYNLDKDAQTIRDNFSDAILNLQSTLGLFSSDMNVYMEDNRLSDDEKDKIEVYKESIETARGNVNTQLDIIAEYFNTTEGEDNEKMIHLNTAKDDLNVSIDNLLTNIDAVSVDDVFTNTEMTAIVTYFGKVNVEINECKNLIDEYIVLGIGGTLIEQVASINLRQDQIKLQVSEHYYSKTEVDEKIENVDIGLVVRNVEAMYYFSTSSTELENGEWSSSMPETELNKYIWSKTVTTYSDGSTSETDPVCITSINNYTWIKYSDSAEGNNMYDEPNENTMYIGIASNKDVSIESSNPSDYEWSRFRGVDGIDYYTWIKYADDENGNGISDDPTDKYYIGFAYNKSTSVESNNPSDYIWSKFKGTDGIDGVDGTSIKILGSYETLEQLNNAHPNNNEIGDSYTINNRLYVWTGSIFEDVGGIKGEDGASLYTWIKYSNSPNGSNMYEVPNDKTEYIGIAVNKVSKTESNNPSDYTWSKFRGDDGVDGTNGKGIVSIIDYYRVHTSNKGITNESGGFSTDVPQMDSVNKYLWSYELITYTDDAITKTSARVIGVFGTDGKGIERVVEYYAVGSSNTVAPTNFSTTVPTFGVEDRFLWNYEIIYYNDGTTLESNKRIIGAQGEKGTNGQGLKSIISEFYLSTSKEEPIGGQWSETPPEWEVGKYMWTRSRLIFEDDSFEYSTPICDATWEDMSDLKNQIDENKEKIETTIDKVADIDIQIDGITSRVSSTEETVTSLGDSIASVETRVSTAEQKITSDAIISTVSSVYATKDEMNTVSSNAESKIEQTAESINLQIASDYYNKSEIDVQIDSINSTITGVDGSISSIQQSLEGINSSISDVEGDISTVAQTANKVNWLIKSGSSASNMTLTDNTYSLIASNISLRGYVTVTDLSGAGTTTINGSNITSGVIRGIQIISSIYNNTNRVEMNGDGHYYYSPSKQAGKIAFDSNGEGTSTSARDRFLLQSLNGYVMKLLSTGDMSITSYDAIYLEANKVQSNCQITVGGSLSCSHFTSESINTGTLSITNSMSVSTLAVTGTLTAGGVTTSGTVKGSSGNFTSLSAGSFSVTGTSWMGTISCGQIQPTSVACSGTINTSGSLQGYTCSIANNMSVENNAWIKYLYVNGSQVTSDQTLKTDIRYVNIDKQTISEDSGLMSPNINITTSDMHEFIETLPMVSYRLIEDVEEGKDETYYGFLAQEILYSKVGSELVTIPTEKEKELVGDKLRYSETKYVSFIAGALQEEIKRRKDETKILNNTIINLEKKIKDLEDKLNK